MSCGCGQTNLVVPHLRHLDGDRSGSRPQILPGLFVSDRGVGYSPKVVPNLLFSLYSVCYSLSVSLLMSLYSLDFMPYPATTLVSIKGKYSVSVTIPNELRSAFGNGNSSNKRLSTGTSDKDLAALKLNNFSVEIYCSFDQKKIELADREANIQRHVVVQFAEAMDVKVKSGYQLNSNTSVIGLYKLQNILDRKAEHILQEVPYDMNYELDELYLGKDVSLFFEELMRKSAERSGDPVPKSDRKTKSL